MLNKSHRSVVSTCVFMSQVETTSVVATCVFIYVIFQKKTKKKIKKKFKRTDIDEAKVISAL